MLTPKFKLDQDDDMLTVTIYAQFARISDTEINIEKNVFLFYSSPYYLRLTLPGNLADSEIEVPVAKYDADQGAFIVLCKKENHGVYFNGLEMLTDLLTPKGISGISKPLIEVLDGEGKSSDSEEEEEMNWLFEQKLPEDNVPNGSKYGFANMETAVFTALRAELSGVVDVANPDQKTACMRREERLADESLHFNEEHYLADLYENELISSYLLYQPSFYSIENVEYTNDDEEILLKLPRRELLIDKGSTSFIYLSLVDILFSWCYNNRITLGENCAESAWNIAKLSPTLSWLDSFHNLKDVIKASIRRSLIFPLIRNWELSNIVLQDTIQILSLGRKQVLKCLVEIYRIFNCYDPYYLLNQLYISNYCIWIQTVKEEKISSLVDSLKKIDLSKEDLNLELVELESAAQMVLEEEEVSKTGEIDNLNGLVDSMEQLDVIENNFALSRNDNDSDHEAPLRCDNDVIPINDSSDSSSSDSDSSSSDSYSNDSDTSSDSSASIYYDD